MLPKIIKAKKIVVGIEEEKLRILEVEKTKNKINVLKAFTIDLIDKLDLLDQVSHIKNKINFENIKRGSAYLIINDEELDLEIIKIPKTQYKNQIKILNYKYMEYEKDNYIQYLDLDQIEDNGLYDGFLVSRLDRAKVDFYKKFIAELGFKPKVLDIKCNSFMKLMGFSRVINSIYNVGEENLLIIDFHRDSSNIVLLEKGGISYVNSMNLGSNYLLNKQAEKDINMEDFQDRIQNIMIFIKGLLKERRKETSLIIVQGLKIYNFISGKALEDIFDKKFIIINDLKDINIDVEIKDWDYYLGYLGGIIREKEEIT